MYLTTYHFLSDGWCLFDIPVSGTAVQNIAGQYLGRPALSTPSLNEPAHEIMVLIT